MNPGKVIFIFRTNIESDVQFAVLHDLFGRRQGVIEWSVDLEDVDKVLRVVCDEAHQFDVAAEVRGRGFNCDELL